MNNMTAIEKTLAYQKNLMFLSQIYLNEVDKELLDNLKSKEILFGYDNGVVKEGLKILQDFIERSQDNVVLDLAVDYTNLFAGAKRESPFPYESVYTSEERLLMQEARDLVLECYRLEGFEDYQNFNEPEDHVSIELNFMAYLSGKIAEALKNNEIELAKKYWASQKVFLDKHLLNWLPVFCEDIEKMASTEFYTGIAKITPRLVAAQPVIN